MTKTRDQAAKPPDVALAEKVDDAAPTIATSSPAAAPAAEPAEPIATAPAGPPPEVTGIVVSDAEMAAVFRHPRTLKPWAKNPKPIERGDVRMMRKSIKRFGFGAPIVARLENSEVIEGHLRLATAIAMGLEKVPVRFMDLPEDEAHVLALAAWNFEHRREANEKEVADILADLDAKDVDLEDGTGFEDEVLDDLLGGSAELDPDSDGDDESGPSTRVRPHKRRLRSSGLKYTIVVTCKNEEHQGRLLEKLEAEGLECKPLVT